MLASAFLMRAASTLEITNGEHRALRKFSASWNLSLLKRCLARTNLADTFKNRSAMRTWGLMLKFIPFGWNAIITYQCLEAELLQAKR